MILFFKNQKSEELILNKEGNEKKNHHIIPKHAGGSDSEWNMILLSPEDQLKAHELRYDVYKEKGDLAAIRFWKDPPKNTLEAQRRRAVLSHETCRTKKIGFFCSEQQRLNGLKGGKVKSNKKIETYVNKLSPVVIDGLSKPMKWKHRTNNEIKIICIEANTLKLVVDLKSFFLEALPEGEEKEKLLKMSTINFSSAVSKVLKGERKTAHQFTLLNK